MEGRRDGLPRWMGNVVIPRMQPKSAIRHGVSRRVADALPCITRFYGHPHSRRVMESLSVPFTNRFWTDTYEAMVTVRGVLRAEPDGLVVEFKRSEWDFSLVRKEEAIHAVHVPWPEVQSLTFRRKLLKRGVLVLRTRSLRTLESVPAVQGNELTLSVSRA